MAIAKKLPHVNVEWLKDLGSRKAGDKELMPFGTAKGLKASGYVKKDEAAEKARKEKLAAEKANREI